MKSFRIQTLTQAAIVAFILSGSFEQPYLNKNTSRILMRWKSFSCKWEPQLHRGSILFVCRFSQRGWCPFFWFVWSDVRQPHCTLHNGLWLGQISGNIGGQCLSTSPTWLCQGVDINDEPPMVALSFDPHSAQRDCSHHNSYIIISLILAYHY